MSLLFLIVMIPALALLVVTIWNVGCWPQVAVTGKAERAHSLSILIPARNEEANLAACLDAALMQGEVIHEVLVYDDHSSDGTPGIIKEYTRRDLRVRAVAPQELPAGWCGKTFACARLASEARGEWLLFLDADARLGANAATNIIEEAVWRKVSLLSCWPALEAGSFWEGALMPFLNLVVFTLYPAPLALKRVRDASLGLAHGSCMLARRDAYNRTGGHSAVREEIFEDVRLAQIWRERGEASLCLDGQRVVTVRMYGSFSEIWRGFQKNFYPAFRREASFWSFITLHFMVFLLPFILLPLFLAGVSAAWPLLVTALCALAMRTALALRFKQPLWSVLLHPLGESVLIALGLSSWWRCKTGRGVEWKGRRYRSGVENYDALLKGLPDQTK
ncbi:MAG: glycosyltransferase [Rubrivivax sp.]|nr:glycosyltransferase [Pyrinomonadaceae bacterium]